jgi:predicted ATPase
MQLTRIQLTNWRNFRSVDVPLPTRGFLIGPNASGKSNFLDSLRFLRDLAMPAGGLQSAYQLRGGVPKIRSLFARKPADVGIHVTLIDDDEVQWEYHLVFNNETRFPQQGMATVTQEIVYKGLEREVILSRPDDADQEDPRLLSQTALEQISANRKFRPVVDCFTAISYLYLVPQMMRDRETIGTFRDNTIPDVYGGRFLESIAKTQEKTRRARLQKIEEVLKIAVPYLRELSLKTDKHGVPHLEAVFEHWRSNAGGQDETQFSDGTLRLIGLLWALQDGSGLMLMEEPELSLHKGIVSRLAPFIHRMQVRGKKTPRQALISTHSVDLLSDPGISADELLIFKPEKNGTTVEIGARLDQIRIMMEEGLPASEVALPYTESDSFVQLASFDL